MTHPDNPDRLPFDLHAFNQAAMARAEEFAVEVGRLAIFDIPDDAGSYDTVHGAVYYLPDSRRLEVKHSIDANDDFTSSLRIFHTHEVSGADARHRRVTTIRAIDYSKDPMVAGIEHELAVDTWEQTDPEVPRPTADAQQAWQNFYEQRALHHMVHMLAGGQPPEIIEATTKTIVEYRMPNGRSYANEYITANSPTEQQQAHEAARRAAGEPANPIPYTVAEHELVMTILTGITNPQQAAERLEDPLKRPGWSM